MRIVLFFVFFLLVVYESQSLPEKCLDNEEECHSTNYEEYVKCVRRRHKRSIDCDSSCDSDNCVDSCGNCDCGSCSVSTCQNSCNSCCSSCCNNYNVCRSNHCCHKVCHAQCRSSSCRSSCRRDCYETVKNMTESDTTSEIHNTDISKHNITTIIHLNNIINNTNIIDMPITVNNTNKHNITIFQKGNSNSIQDSNPNCCVVIGPRQCVPQKEAPFAKCFHYRSQQCGEYCTAPIVHQENQQVCQPGTPYSPPNCTQKVIYIPQPQPRCAYQSTWPYVACGVPRPSSCAGCYSHYVNPNADEYRSCSSACYDNGYGVGPYYRQGPVYRPNYYHMPFSTCFSFPGYGYGGYPGYGGFPIFGNAPSPGGYPAYGGYQGYGGFPGYGGYPSNTFGQIPAYGGSPDTVPIPLNLGGLLPYGSWSPEIQNNFTRVNESQLDPERALDPEFIIQPSWVNNNLYNDVFRPTREVEIEIDVQPETHLKAELKVKNSNISAKEESTKNDTTKVSTEPTPVEKETFTKLS